MRKCTHCGFDNPKEVDFCLNCAAALEQFCPTCGATAQVGMRFCGQCGARLPDSAVRQSQRLKSLQTLMPASLAHKINASADRLLGERRDVTVVFIEIGNFSQNVRQLDSEQVYLVVDDAMRTFVDVIYKYEGTIDKFTGDGLMALFGAPVTHENDPERAVRAALEAQAAFEPLRQSIEGQHGVNFAVRIGINTGLVVAGQLGTDLHMEYTVVGDTVNLAAQLQSAAAPGTILVSQETYQRTRPLFEYKAINGLVVKGIPGPILAAQPLSVLARPGRLRGLSDRPQSMIGRQSDLTQMLDALEVVERTQRSRLVLITGEAGLGKSRLVAEFRRAVTQPAVRIYDGSCLAYARSRPLWILAEILRNILDLREADPVERQRETLRVYIDYLDLPAEEVLPYLNTVLGLPQSDPEVEMRLRLLDAPMLQRQTHAALRQVLVAETNQASTVLIFDDLHWVDPASRDFLEYLIQTTGDVPLLLVLVSRDLERQTVIQPVIALAQKHPEHLVDIQLQPLSPDEGRLLVSQLLSPSTGALSALEQQIAARADGNPFFIEEMVRMLMERGGLARVNETWQVPRGGEDLMQDVPGTLKGLILARFDRLPEQPRRRLQVAAAVGRSFPAGLLQRLNPDQPEALLGDLDLLAARQFLVPEAFGAEAGYAFRHALVQEAVYGTMLKRDLQRIHEAIAAAIEQTNSWSGDEQIEVLAYHFAEGRSPARAVPFLVAAAENAARRYANQTAIQHYRRAIGLMQTTASGPPRGIIRARLGLGQALKFMGQFGEAANVLTEAVEDVQHWPGGHDPQTTVMMNEALRELADVRQREGAWEAAFGHLVVALNALGENAAANNPALWRPLIERMAWIRFRQGNLDEALKLASSATSAVDLKRTDDPITLASLANTLGGVFWQQGNLPEATSYVQRSLRLYEGIGYSFGMANAYTNLGVLYYGQGLWAKASENFERSDKLRREIGYITGRAGNLQNLGLVRMAMGNHTQARLDLETSLALSQRLGEEYDIVKAQIGLAQLAIIQSRFDDAARYVEAAQAHRQAATPDERVQTIWNRALVQAQQGDLAAAIESATQALDMARGADLAESEVDCRRILGVLHAQGERYAEAEAHLRESVARALSSADRYREALALLELGRVYQRWSGADNGTRVVKRQQALAAYHQAHELFQGLGASYDLNLAAAGVDQVEAEIRQTPPTRASLPARTAPGAEWHPAVVMWCELEAPPGTDVEAVFETLTVVMPALVSVSEAHQGYLVRRASGLTVVFGAQVVHEDDGVRAVQTALDYLRRLSAPQLAGEVPLTVRLAVSAGPVVAGPRARGTGPRPGGDGDGPLAGSRAPGTGPLGQPRRPEIMVTGEPLQLAQHLAAVAPPGRVWVTQPVYDSTQHRFAYHNVRPAETDLPADLGLWELDGERDQPGSARGLPGTRPQLIGRETPMEAMLSMAQTVNQGVGGLIWIEGEAGIGKTRLMREFEALVTRRGFSAWYGQCTAQQASHAFSLIADLLVRLFNLQSTDTPEQIQSRLSAGIADWPAEAAAVRPYLELLVGVGPSSPEGERLAELGPDQLRQQIHVALRTVVKSLAGTRPLVLLLDDLHWIDPLSTDLLLFLSNLIASTQILFVCALRWDEAEIADDRLIKVQSLLRPERVLRLHLERLSQTEAETLLGQLLGDDDLPLELRQFVLRRSEGNPFYLEEVVRTLVEQKYLHQRDGRWQIDLSANLQDLPLPSSLGALIQSRVDSLPPDLRQWLQCAAVIGGAFEESLLSAVAQMPGVPAAVTRLEARGMLRHTAKMHEWQFMHTLIETAVYNSLLKAHRQELHRQVAEILERRWGPAASAHAAELAYHYGQANAGDRALPYLMLAAEQAASRYANEEALVYFQQAALEVSQRPGASVGLRWRVAMGLGDVYRFIGEYSASQAALQTGLALIESPELGPVARAGLYRRLGETAHKLGAFEAALGHFDKALNFVEATGDEPASAEAQAEAARALLGQAVTHLRQGRLEQARQACVASATQARLADSLGDLAAVENLLGGIYYQLSDWEQAMAHTRRAMGLREELGHTWGVAATASNLGILAILAGDWGQAGADFERSLVLRQEIGDVEGIAIAHGNLGSLARDQGDLEQAEMHFGSSLEMASSLNMAYHVASAATGLADVLLRKGKIEAADTLLASSQLQAAELGAQDLACENYRVRASLLLAQGELDLAGQAARRSAELAADLGDRSLESAAWRVLSQVELRQGNAQAARNAIDRAQRMLHGVTSKLDVGQVALQAGRVSQQTGDLAAAERQFEMARGLFIQLGARSDLDEVELALLKLPHV